MALTTKERTELRQELVGQGYSWEYIDEWQPKVSLYRHRAMVSPSGEIVSQVGTKLMNLPGSPDYVSRKARQGLYPWPPSDTCSCRWCGERKKVGESYASAESSQPDSTPGPSTPRGRGTRQMGPYFQG
jgi:hypothetical protein